MPSNSQQSDINLEKSTIRFSSCFCNQSKIDLLAKHFKQVKELKNKISSNLYNQIDKVLEDPYSYGLKTFLDNYKVDFLLFNELQKLVQDIVIRYETSYKKKLSNIKFEHTSSNKFIYYKKNISIHKKGDLNYLEVNTKKYILSFILERLLKTSKEITSDLIEQELLSSINYFSNKNSKILEKLGKFLESFTSNKIVFTRIITNLINMKKTRIKVKRIEFKNGTYSKYPKEGKKTSASGLHKSHTSKHYSYWYEFRIGLKQTIQIPITINKSYHSPYFNQLDRITTVRLNNKQTKLEIFLPVDREKLIQTLDNPTSNNTIGIDINTRDNLFSLSNNTIVDYNRTLLDKSIKRIARLEKRKSKLEDKASKESLSLNNRKQKDSRRLEHNIKDKIALLLKDLVSNNITNIVLEDLSLYNTRSFWLREKDLDVRYTKLVRSLHLSSIKTWFYQQARKYNINIHLIPSQYTSKGCDKCFNIDNNNRYKANFKCTSCGNTLDADYGASLSIKQVLLQDVLRESLLTLDKDTGRYIPKTRNKTRIKNIYDSLHLEWIEKQQVCNRLSNLDNKLEDNSSLGLKDQLKQF